MDSSISIYISILYRYRRSFLIKKLENYGALGGLYQLVLTIHHRNGMNQEQISDLLKTDKAAVARAVKKLEIEGYVSRVTDTGDKRANKVYLTPKGQALVPVIVEAIKEWEQRVLEGLPGESYELVELYLKQMAENACRI